MPLGALTMPSSRNVPICNPGLPGGKFAAFFAAASCRLVNDSNGSRLATFCSLSAGAAPGVPGVAFGAAPAFLVLVLAGAVAVPAFSGGGVGAVFVCA